MKVLIAGGRGFVGSALSGALRAAGHDAWALTRRLPKDARDIQWDARSRNGWTAALNDMDAVVNATGYGLEHWPWTTARKRRFLDSRVTPGRTLAAAIQSAERRPKIFMQISGINYYGLRGDGIADESTPGADDYLANLTAQWEQATFPVEALGLRRIVARTAVVLSSGGGMLPLMALPARCFFGGRLGSGVQAMNWIHVTDFVNAIRFLMEHDDARGIYNLIAPAQTSNQDFMGSLARALGRPYWLPVPETMLRAVLGEMSDLIVAGRFSRPKRLLDLDYHFEYPTAELALENLFGESQDVAATEL